MTIKEIRHLTGMTQAQFGTFLGIPMRSIQNWETGQRKCPDYLVELIRYRMDYIIMKRIEEEKE